MRFRVVTFISVLLVLSLATGSVLMWRLFALSLLVLLFGYLWSHLNIRGITVQAQIASHRYQVGEWVEVEYSVFNHSRLPKPMVKVRVNSELSGPQDNTVINLAPKAAYSWRTRLFCHHRGRFAIGSLTVTTNEPFGFFTPHRSLGNDESLLVYPAVVKLPFFRMASGTEYGYGASRWSAAQMSPSAAYTRGYMAGDSLNHIHWHSTAHTGELMVKVFDSDRPENPSSHVWVIADMQRGSPDGAPHEASEEYCVTIAASLVKKSIDDGKRTGLITHGSQSYFFPPQDEHQHLWHMLEAIALVRATGEVPIAQLIMDEKGHFGTNCVVILVTSSDNIASSDNGTMIEALHELTNRGATVTAVVLDSSSFGGASDALVPASRLTAANIPAYVVGAGDDLAAVLDNRAISARRRLVNG